MVSSSSPAAPFVVGSVVSTPYGDGVVVDAPVRARGRHRMDGFICKLPPEMDSVQLHLGWGRIYIASPPLPMDDEGESGGEAEAEPNATDAPQMRALQVCGTMSLAYTSSGRRD
jgi:hypothetical protein